MRGHCDRTATTNDSHTMKQHIKLKLDAAKACMLEAHAKGDKSYMIRCKNTIVSCMRENRFHFLRQTSKRVMFIQHLNRCVVQFGSIKDPKEADRAIRKIKATSKILFKLNL